VIGARAVAIVYSYCGCDRVFSHPRLGTPPVRFRDRFTGRVFTPSPAAVRAFAELTVANELDVMRHDAALAAAGSGLIALFRSWDGLLSWHARAAVEQWAHARGW